jgi:acetyl esterase/lipase
MSQVGAAMLKARAEAHSEGVPRDADIVVARAQIEQQLAPMVAGMRQLYPVNVAEMMVDGVRTRIVTPQHGDVDSQRVLINLHGGSFCMCAEGCALLESLPLAGLGKFKVVMVDYRMAPEASHPAALEDVERVYRELLKEYRHSQIGIFGGSAGGVLTSQMAARLPARGLSQVGAIGIFGAGAVPFGFGDSGQIAPYIEGVYPPPPADGLPALPLDRGYFANLDMADPLISPGMHLEVLRKFPSTLIITGSRAFDLSPAIYTHSQLLKAGVHSQLIVGEALGHCYIYNPFLPEALDAHRVMVDFFNGSLG